MERKIGEIFELGGEWYQCVESDSCGECSLFTTECGSGTKSDLADEVFSECSKARRTDNKHVIFKKLEKVGEPITYMNRTFQRIKSLDDNICKYCYFKNQVCNPQLCGEVFFLVEIKKVIEDMGEEKDIKPYDKYFSNGTVSNTDNLPKSNLKPFNLEAAKAGEPVCTRDGRPARIICFNRVSDKFPIIALVMGRENREDVFYYDNNGKDCYNKEKDYDLVMKPKVKTGWINVHKENGLYETEEDAKNNRLNDDFVAVKVEFEI